MEVKILGSQMYVTAIDPFVYATCSFKVLRIKDQGVNAHPKIKGKNGEITFICIIKGDVENY